MGQERRKGGRRQNDRRAASKDKDKATLTNERSIGAIEHDERGDARWVWASEQKAQESLERTFDELKALDNAALTLLEQAEQSKTKAPPGGGYNPYNTTEPPNKKVASKTRR